MRYCFSTCAHLCLDFFAIVLITGKLKLLKFKESLYVTLIYQHRVCVRFMDTFLQH